MTTLASAMFYGCTSLTNVTLPTSLDKVPSKCFYGCTSLESATIQEGPTSIESSAFEGCSSLTTVSIPESVNTINDSAFRSCTSLDNVVLNGVKTIQKYAFSGCTSLSNLTISDSVKTIYDYAFLNDTSLTSVVIPDSVKTIGTEAFGGRYSWFVYYKIDGFTIYGTADSAAEDYATTNGFDFVDVATGEVPATTTPTTNPNVDTSNFVNGVFGDVNNDGVRNVIDLLVLKKALLGIIEV